MLKSCLVVDPPKRVCSGPPQVQPVLTVQTHTLPVTAIMLDGYVMVKAALAGDDECNAQGSGDTGGWGVWGSKFWIQGYLVN